MYVFSDAQVAELVPLITDALADFDANPTVEGVFTDAYQAVYDAITVTIGPGNMEVPADGV